MTPYKLLAICIVVAGIIYGIYSLFMHERGVGYQQCVAEQTTKQLRDEVDARSKEARLTKQLQDAQHAATLREQENKKLSDALAIANRQLRDTTTALRNKLSTDSCDAVRRTADAALTVFGECQEQYTAMGENATRHASDVITLTQAWPK